MLAKFSQQNCTIFGNFADFVVGDNNPPAARGVLMRGITPVEMSVGVVAAR